MSLMFDVLESDWEVHPKATLIRRFRLDCIATTSLKEAVLGTWHRETNKKRSLCDEVTRSRGE